MAGSHVALDIEAAGFGGDGGEAMVPPFAVDLRAESIDPQRKRGLQPDGVLAELIVGTQVHAPFELGVTLRPPLAQHPVEGPLEATLG